MEALAYFASTHTDDLRTTVLRKDKELRQVAQCILRLGSKTTTSPFRLATELRRPKAIRAIAQYYKPDISVIDSPTLSDLLNAKLDDESPALYYAVSKGYKDCVDELLAAGADPLCRYKGWNILHIAV
jgi:ankyrin repeat protein